MGVRHTRQGPAPRGAAVAALAYEFKGCGGDVRSAAVDDFGLPECHLCFYDRVARFDPRPLATGEAVAPRHSPPDGAAAPPSHLAPPAYKRAVQRVRDYIVAGE